MAGRCGLWRLVASVMMVFSAAIVPVGTHAADKKPVDKRPVEKKSGEKKAAAARAAEKTLVLVNGEKITDGDVDRLLQFRQVPPAERDSLRQSAIEQLIDAKLIKSFLASRDTTASRQELDAEIERVRNVARKDGKDPSPALSEAGFSDERLRQELALPLAWRRHANRAITDKRLREYFDLHHAEFDGTQVRASQILLRLAADAKPADVQAAEKKLAQLRAEILANQLTFAAAARQFSQAPSREQGGDVGYFPWSGKMPKDVSRVAFGLKLDEISPPFRSPFGMHLCLVTDRKEGELSLEDVREQVFARVSDEMWQSTLAEQRKSAKIEWKVKPAG